MKHRSSTTTWSVAAQRLTTLVFGTSLISDIRRVAKLEPMSRLYRIYQSGGKEEKVLAATWDGCYSIYDSPLLMTTVTRLSFGDRAVTLFNGFLVLLPRPTAEPG